MPSHSAWLVLLRAPLMPYVLCVRPGVCAFLFFPCSLPFRCRSTQWWATTTTGWPPSKPTTPLRRRWSLRGQTPTGSGTCPTDTTEPHLMSSSLSPSRLWTRECPTPGTFAQAPAAPEPGNRTGVAKASPGTSSPSTCHPKRNRRSLQLHPLHTLRLASALALPLPSPHLSLQEPAVQLQRH